MKKLMIAAFAAAFAGVAQAGYYSWSSSSKLYTWNSSEATVTAGTPAYFVFAAAYSQSDLVSDFNTGKTDMTKLGASNGQTPITADGTINSAAAIGGYTSGQQVYFAVLADDKLFISGEVTAVYDDSMSWVSFKDAQVSDVCTGNAMDASAGYKGAGWYSAAVPEPTSGLLLLVGGALLALRRRRA